MLYLNLRSEEALKDASTYWVVFFLFFVFVFLLDMLTLGRH